MARRFCVLLALLPALHSTAQKTEELAVSALRLAACARMALLYELGAESGIQRGPPRPGMARQSLADARVGDFCLSSFSAREAPPDGGSPP